MTPRIRPAVSQYLWTVLALSSVLLRDLAYGQPQIPLSSPSFWSFAILLGDGTCQVVWFDVSSAGQAWQVQRAADPQFLNNVATVPGTPGLLCSGCTAQFTLSDPQSAGRRHLLGATDFYRVQLVDAANGAVNLTSKAMQPSYSGAGAFFAYPAPYGTTNAGCGAWTAPCALIQNALDSAPTLPAPSFPLSSPPPQYPAIFLGPGIYRGIGNRALTFRGAPKSVLALTDATTTIIDAQLADRGLVFSSGETYFSYFSGVTVMNGAASDFGGCILIADASPTIANVVLMNCQAGAGGGAMFINSNPAAAAPSWPILDSSRIFNCTSANGGGIYVQYSAVNITNSYFQFCAATQPGAGRGGALVVSTAAFTMQNTVIANGSAVFSGGAIHTEVAQTLAPLLNVTIQGNEAISFGGGITSFGGSNMTLVNCDISENLAGFYAGGVLALYGLIYASGTKFNRNRSLFGAGGCKALAGVLVFDSCEISDNVANSGAAIEIARQAIGPQNVPTIVYIANSIIARNTVLQQGAAFNLASCQQVVFQNVSFVNNSGTNGGAGYCEGDGDPTSLGLTIYQSSFLGNSAQLGGGFYASTLCNATIIATGFEGNLAREYGGAILAGSSSLVDISFSTFTNNGNFDCFLPPLAGGAINVGYTSFTASSSCSATDAPPQPTVRVTQSLFTGNLATDRGGAIGLQAGRLFLSAVSMSSNNATGGAAGSAGLGGALYVADACTNGICSSVDAVVSGISMTGNFAYQAGGALFFNGSSPGSGLQLSQGLLSANAVHYDLKPGSEAGGTGGAVFVASGNLTLAAMQIKGNAALLGGGLYLSTDLAQDVELQGLAFQDNFGLLGTSVYWRHDSSLNESYACQTCSYSPQNNITLSTEALKLAYLTPPPQSVQSQESAPVFSVGLLDYYGSLGVNENAGQCQVTYRGTDVTLPELGRVVDIRGGIGTFQQFQILGGIGNNFSLAITCSPSPAMQSSLLPEAADVWPLPLDIGVALCPRGTEQKGSICSPCDINFFSLNGTGCKPCPPGALCPGGSLGQATPLLNQQGYWRSSPQSSQLYRCVQPSQCRGTPSHPGNETGEAACNPGATGPLCAVCKPGTFAFGGMCKQCGNARQGSIMLALGIIILASVIIILFARNWGVDTGPGVMVKVKIFITHVQTMALLRDYDVTWPSGTHNALSWADTLNIGVSITAPQCYIGDSFNFYFFYVLQMAMPIVLVLLCIIVNFFATQMLDYLADCERGSFLTAAREKRWRLWLMDLQTRCYKNSFWFVTLLYPRCAMTALQLFATDTLDIGTFLRADYSVIVRPVRGDLTSTYKIFLAIGTALILLFAVIAPASYFLILFHLRHRLDEEIVKRKFGFLYAGYSLHYWETAEMIRKLALAAIPTFIKPQPAGSLQAVLGEIVLVLYLFAVTYTKPYIASADNHLHMGSLAVLWLILLSGEAIKWATLSTEELRLFSAAQLMLTTGLACLVVITMILRKSHVDHFLQGLWRRMRPWRHGQIVDESLDSMTDSLAKAAAERSLLHKSISARRSSAGQPASGSRVSAVSPQLIAAARHPPTRANSTDDYDPDGPPEEHSDNASHENYDHEALRAPLSRANSWTEAK